MLSINDIQQAHKRIKSHINKTPVVSSTLLNTWLGHDIYFKAECMQKIGAFKARGACNTIAWLNETNARPQRIVANSSGNHAQAVAWAANRFGIPATIFMPSYSSKVKIQATEAYGATVVLGETRIITDEQVRMAANEEGTYWIPPFNHEQVIAGQGTAAFEALQELDKLDAVFASCGGGGLLSGTLIATRALSPGTKVIGAEPLNANDAAISLRNNKIHKLTTAPNTIADGAMTMAIGDLTFDYLKQLDGFYEIEEEPIKYWTQWLSHLLKLHIEPTSAMAMEAVVRWLRTQTAKQRVMVVLSGGNVDHTTQQTLWAHNRLDKKPSI